MEEWGNVYTRRSFERPKVWDVEVTAEAPQIAGDDVEFATLPSGDVIVDEEQGDADLAPLAEAIERELQPPYRAVGRRQEKALWAVVARRIDVRSLAIEHGDVIDLVVRDGRRDLRIDRVPSTVAIPELERAGDYVVHAERLDGELWEIQAETL